MCGQGRVSAFAACHVLTNCSVVSLAIHTCCHATKLSISSESVSLFALSLILHFAF